MARGKYAVKADIRRDREELVSRAEAAEAARAKAEHEKNEELARARAEVNALHAELSALRKLADEESSPALEAARRTMEDQRVRIEELSNKIQELRQFLDDSNYRLAVEMAREFGITNIDASDWIIAVYNLVAPDSWDSEEFARNVAGAKGKTRPRRRPRETKLPYKTEMLLDRAKGKRVVMDDPHETTAPGANCELGPTNRDLAEIVRGIGG